MVVGPTAAVGLVERGEYVSMYIYVKTVKIICISIMFLCQWNLSNIFQY